MDIKTTFAASNVTLDVVCRSMKKKGIAVFLRSKTGKKKAVLGCRQLFKAGDEEAAKARYEELVKETTAKGWPVKGETVKVKSAGSFSEVPAPPVIEPAAPPVEPTEPKPEEPAEERELVGAGAGKGNGNGKGKGKGK